MGFIINNKIKTKYGIELDTFYVRIDVRLSLDCKSLISNLYFYISKDIFKAGANQSFEMIEAEIPYDREINGVDILTYAHTKLKESLEYVSTDDAIPSFGFTNVTIDL